MACADKPLRQNGAFLYRATCISAPSTGISFTSRANCRPVDKALMASAATSCWLRYRALVDDGAANWRAYSPSAAQAWASWPATAARFPAPAVAYAQARVYLSAFALPDRKSFV